MVAAVPPPLTIDLAAAMRPPSLSKAVGCSSPRPLNVAAATHFPKIAFESVAAMIDRLLIIC